MPVPRPFPKLMTIGDSLAQGCRSLSVNESLCAQSWSARIASAVGWEFVAPNHPRPVLFDLESEIRRLNPVAMSADGLRLQGIVQRLLDNFRAWQQQPFFAVECFDNLAVAGALVGDLCHRTAATSDADISSRIGPNVLNLLDADNLGDIHLDINARFVLNPSKKPDYAQWSQMRWVEARLPENLIVHVGHNHGLFAVGSSALLNNPTDPKMSITQPGAGQSQSYFDQWRELATRLAQLPDDVKQIIVLSLPKVGSVGNLSPVGAERTNGYAVAYEPAFSTHSRMLGSDLALVDQAILKVNKDVHDILVSAATTSGRPQRLKFIDAYNLLDRLDYKNIPEPARRVTISAGNTIDNRYLSGKFHFGWPKVVGFELAAGGFFSVDGMHPSGAGYAKLAVEVLKALTMPVNEPSLLQAAFAQDRLLSNYPPELDMLVALLSVLRSAINVGHFSQDGRQVISEDAHFADVLHIFKSLFVRA